jgi:hypothetical protein
VPVIELAEHTFDGISHPIGLGVERVWMFAGRIVGNDDGRSASGKRLRKGACIITLIAKEDFAQRRCGEQVGRGRDVRDVACTEPKDAQPPSTIADQSSNNNLSLFEKLAESKGRQNDTGDFR